ncbi:hypothetical protein Esti_004065 [Eimeria stiedai]
MSAPGFARLATGCYQQLARCRAGSGGGIASRSQLSRRRAGLLLRRQRRVGGISSSPSGGGGLAALRGVRSHQASAAMHPSCRWFVAAGCWLMACLVAPGAFRVAAALSVPRSAAAAAAAASSFGVRSNEEGNSGRSVGGGSGFFAGSMPRAATNAAAAAAAAAALAALATGTLSLGLEGRSAAAPVSPAAAESLQSRRESVFAALEAAFGPNAASGAFCPLSSRATAAGDLLRAKHEQQPMRLAAPAAVAAAAAVSSSEPAGLVSSVKQGALQGFDALKQGALSLCREGGEMAACTLKALQAWRSSGPWAPLGAVWRWRLGAKGLILRRIDAGGGGDCLFHSVALSLTARGAPVSSLLLRRIAADGAVGLKACELGAVFTPKEETLFLERLGVMAALEAANEWQDGWSPSAVLESKKEYVATTGLVFDTSTTLGKAKAVHYEMRLPGNNHWGTASDICALEDSLDVGIIVMDDFTGKIYPTACDRKLRKHYMFLYFVGGCHFQLVGLQTPDGHKSLFTPEELPPALIKLFEEDTKNALFPQPWVSDSGKTFTHAKVEPIGASDHTQTVSPPSN